MSFKKNIVLASVAITVSLPSLSCAMERNNWLNDPFFKKAEERMQRDKPQTDAWFKQAEERMQKEKPQTDAWFKQAEERMQKEKPQADAWFRQADERMKSDPFFKTPISSPNNQNNLLTGGSFGGFPSNNDGRGSASPQLMLPSPSRNNSTPSNSRTNASSSYAEQKSTSYGTGNSFSSGQGATYGGSSSYGPSYGYVSEQPSDSSSYVNNLARLSIQEREDREKKVQLEEERRQQEEIALKKKRQLDEEIALKKKKQLEEERRQQEERRQKKLEEQELREKKLLQEAHRKEINGQLSQELSVSFINKADELAACLVKYKFIITPKIIEESLHKTDVADSENMLKLLRKNSLVVQNEELIENKSFQQLLADVISSTMKEKLQNGTLTFEEIVTIFQEISKDQNQEISGLKKLSEIVERGLYSFNGDTMTVTEYNENKNKNKLYL